MTLNEIEMQRLFQPQNPPPVQQIFHLQPQVQHQPQQQVQPQPQPQAQDQSETLNAPQAFLSDNIYIEGTIHVTLLELTLFIINI